MKLNGKTVLTFATLALGAVSAFAQPVISAKSGIIARAEGEVFIGDTAVADSPATFPEVKENAILRTEHGRAEVLLTRGVYMRIGESASFKMLTNRLIDTRPNPIKSFDRAFAGQERFVALICVVSQ